MFNEFKTFIARGNVMDMAVGIIIGAAFTAIVTSLVGDLINPIIGLFTGGIDFTNQYVVLAGDVPADASLAAAREAGASVFAYGAFLMAVINFLIVAWVVFLMVKAVNTLKDAAKREEEVAPEAPAAPAGPTQEDLLAEIRDLLKAR
ncbi:MAG: large conductance mechanosensitive channel protein MscL [Rhodobacter sp.]|uniref:large conductance mechanosensitive channel protein MscL n=1 Tax=Pararhodobacter sp. TaxID=2127056 RepID=UPI001DB2C1B6|nr:large conductance mechanosensitive channel protein MscL [Pararhodobacter sp.]MCB1345769.1 large conductance mechanosensitive channel protein MscL [Paracoccaceae bacterium]MCC0074415.1 large conductance mechanosensitive channel protein MscL [Rhodobacter sp.]HPD91395.1 large conductance mechanosensitive channel protein MscL [Pararhodobacter sp.]